MARRETRCGEGRGESVRALTWEKYGRQYEPRQKEQQVKPSWRRAGVQRQMNVKYLQLREMHGSYGRGEQISGRR